MTRKKGFYSTHIEEIAISAFRDISITFPGDVFILAAWLAALDKAKSTPTLRCGITVHGLVSHYISMYGTNYEKPLTVEKVMTIFAENNITGNPIIRFDKDVDVTPNTTELLRLIEV